jgi:hypothetical protein
MKRREVLGALGFGLGGAALLGAAEARAQEQHHHHDKLHVACLKACSDCANVCNETFHHCFEQVKDGHQRHYRAAALTMDCHEFCCLTADLIGRESEVIALACRACADVCAKCAEECAKHEDAQMKECVEACKVCEKACRAMAKAPTPRSDLEPNH